VRALYVIPPILGILSIAYRYYSAFIAARVMCLDGHHFAAIAGAGPLLGPVLAAQFGYAPGVDLAGRPTGRQFAVHSPQFALSTEHRAPSTEH
jgi:carbon starvation protein CstA